MDVGLALYLLLATSSTYPSLAHGHWHFFLLGSPCIYNQLQSFWLSEFVRSLARMFLTKLWPYGVQQAKLCTDLHCCLFFTHSDICLSDHVFFNYDFHEPSSFSFFIYRILEYFSSWGSSKLEDILIPWKSRMIRRDLQSNEWWKR